MCKYSTRKNDARFPRENGVSGGLEAWATMLLKGTGSKSFAFRCYHSRDVQTRYLATPESAWGTPERPPRVEDAIRTLDHAFVVGITEAYQESACLLATAATGHAAPRVYRAACVSDAPRRRRGRDVGYFEGPLDATGRFGRRADIPRRRRGRDVDVPRRRVSAAPRPRRGSSVKTPAATWRFRRIFRGDDAVAATATT